MDGVAVQGMGLSALTARISCYSTIQVELVAETWKASVGRACGICGSVAVHGTGSGGSLLFS